MVLGVESGPLEEQSVLLTTEPSLQPHALHLSAGVTEMCHHPRQVYLLTCGFWYISRGGLDGLREAFEFSRCYCQIIYYIWEWDRVSCNLFFKQKFKKYKKREAFLVGMALLPECRKEAEALQVHGQPGICYEILPQRKKNLNTWWL